MEDDMIVDVTYLFKNIECSSVACPPLIDYSYR